MQRGGDGLFQPPGRAYGALLGVVSAWYGGGSGGPDFAVAHARGAGVHTVRRMHAGVPLFRHYSCSAAKRPAGNFVHTVPRLYGSVPSRSNAADFGRHAARHGTGCFFRGYSFFACCFFGCGAYVAAVCGIRGFTEGGRFMY